MSSVRPRLRAPTDADTVPVSYVVNVVELVTRWGIPREVFLAGAPVRAEALENPSERVTLAAMNAMVARARDMTGEPGLGFHIGLQKRISVYGFLGFAMMTASNVRECVELAVRFTPVLTSWVTLRLDVQGELALLTLEPQVDLGDVHDVATLSLVVGLGHIATALTGQAIDAAVEFEMPEPPYYRRFERVMPGARFGQAATRVVFPRAALDLPLASSDRAAMLLARAECERALGALVEEAQVSGRVRRVLASRGRFLGLHEVAAELRVSPRTLVRRLGAEGLTFSEIVERERREHALAMLGRQGVSLEEVTARLEYSTVPNFIRAFKRWTGTTPAIYRRVRAAPPAAKAGLPAGATPGVASTERRMAPTEHASTTARK